MPTILRIGGSNGGVSPWFGDGSDGDLTVAANTTHTEDVISDAGQIIKNYNNLTIEAGAVWKPSNRCNGVVLLVKGNLILHGTISVDKCAPFLNDSEEQCAQEQHIRLCGALIGGAGGSGTIWSGGTAPAGGVGFNFGGGLGAGGRGNVASNPSYTAWSGARGDPRPPAGITPWPWITPANSNNGAYGSGGSTAKAAGGAAPGGSGAYNTTAGNPGDAYGGGAIWIFVGGTILIDGIISAKGGNGADGAGTYGRGGPGGGGGGGIIVLVRNNNQSYTNAGTFDVSGGLRGTSEGNISSEIYSTDGSIGTTLLTTLQELL